MRFYERFCSFRALRIIGKCTSRHLFAYGGLRLPDFYNNLRLVAQQVNKTIVSFSCFWCACFVFVFVFVVVVVFFVLHITCFWAMYLIPQGEVRG